MKSHPTTDSAVANNSAVSSGPVQSPATKPVRQRELLLLLSALAFIGFGVWIWGPWRVEPELRLRISAGKEASTRHRMVLELGKHLRKHRIQLEVVASEGSEQSLDWLNEKKIDLALVQGGLALGTRTEVRQLAALQLEPLHVLVKSNLEDSFDKKKDWNELRGKRVFVDSPSSGTHVLAVNLLEFVGLGIDPARDPNSVIVADGFANLDDVLQASNDALPDAIFHVSMVPSPMVDNLVDKKGYRLVEVPYARAFSSSGYMNIDGRESMRLKMSEQDELNRSLVSECTIPAYTYSVTPKVPDRDLRTVGSRMLLVAHQKQPNESMQRLLKAVFDSDLARNTGLDLDTKTFDLPTEYESHPGVELYRNRNKVLIASDAIEYMENLLAITATVVGAMFFLYQWYAEHRRSERESRFAEFMTRVIAIEQSALNTEVSSKLDLGNLIRMQRELANLKAEAVRGFAAGEWHGTHMLNGLLALINDTREQLTRLILHERENIEKSAAAQQLDPDTLWRAEAMDWEEK